MISLSYKVLYRKYRPQIFSDVVGQDHITLTLKNELLSNRLAHAYLFTGSRGTGKTTCAKILAKAINCLDLQDGDPCGKCENCVGIDNGSIMDVVEIDAASNNRVDDVRTLIEEVAFTPANAKYRVYIIDEVHELSQSAFNALLKTLEEPPEHAVFILATTEVHKLLVTILSRCQRFDFRRITAEDIAGRLEYIGECENVLVDHEAALMIARIADGGMRDAISILDQCIARNSSVDINTVETTAGIVSRDNLFELTDAVIKSDSVIALELISKMYEASKDLSRLCEELLMQFRHLMLIKTMGDKLEMIAMSSQELDRLEKQAISASLPLILHAMDTFAQTLNVMKYSNQRIELEMAFVRLCSPEMDSSKEALLRRIEDLEQRKLVPQKQATAKPEKETPVKPAVEVNEELYKNVVVFDKWQEVVHIIKNYSRTIGAAFGDSTAYISGSYMLIDGSDMAFEYLRTNPVYKDKLREAIQNVTGVSYKLGPYKGKTIKQKNNDPLQQLADSAIKAGIEVEIS